MGSKYLVVYNFRSNMLVVVVIILELRVRLKWTLLSLSRRPTERKRNLEVSKAWG